MKKLIIALFLLPGALYAQSERPRSTKVPEAARYQIIVVEYDMDSDFVRSNPRVPMMEIQNVKTARRNVAIIKLDTITGKTWIFKSGLNQEDKIVEFWVELP